MNNVNIIPRLFFSLLAVVLSCTGNPTIKFDEIVHDFGEAGQNSELKHIFLFKNTGSGTLIIEKVRAD